MAYFKLDLLTPVVSQDNESNNRDVYFLKDTITDFYSQSLDTKNATHSFSFDEKFSCHIYIFNLIYNNTIAIYYANKKGSQKRSF